MKWMFEHCEAAPTPLGGGPIAHSLIRPAQLAPYHGIRYLTGVSGSIPILAIVTIGFHVKRSSKDERWMYLEIPDCFYAPESTIELYPVQHCFALLGWRHQFDDVCTISVPGGFTIPFVNQPGRGYHMTVAYDTRRLSKLPPSLVQSARTGANRIQPSGGCILIDTSTAGGPRAAQC